MQRVTDLPTPMYTPAPKRNRLHNDAFFINISTLQTAQQLTDLFYLSFAGKLNGKQAANLRAIRSFAQR